MDDRWEHERAHEGQQSPWTIGISHWDQRDLYTRNASTDDDGYGRGPARHPEEGSYAYPREPRPAPSTAEHGATLHEREAWPWLNYPSGSEDPYFAHLHRDRRSLWQRMKGLAVALSRRLPGRTPSPSSSLVRPDARLLSELEEALSHREDLDATDIDVTVARGEVSLEGTVPDRVSKRIAQQTCERVRGVRRVHNRLAVREDPTDPDVVFVRPLGLLAAW